jgi:hypothetical protein
MFGTIGHARLKNGARAQLQSLMDDWTTTIRPTIPGSFVNLVGNAAGRPDDLVFVALAQDEATYRALAALPEQDAWYRRMAALIEGDVRWEDVEMDRADA